MSKHLEISRYVYILGLICLPLVVTPFSETPYTLSKTFFLAIFLSLSFLFLMLSKLKGLKFPNILITIFFIFEVIQGILLDNSLLFPRYSEHFTISILIYLLIFLGINLFEKLDLEKIIFYSSVVVIFTVFFDTFLTNQRISGTLGQANFLSIFLVLGFLITFKNLKFPLKISTALYLFISSILIIKTASLTSTISLVIGLLILRKKFYEIEKKFIFLASVITLTTLIFFGDIFVSKSLDIYNQIFKPEETIISDSFLIRKNIWIITIDILKQNPLNFLTGFGSNNFENYFEVARTDKLKNYSEENMIFDKPHNYYLEIVFNKGILGFLIFIYLIFKSVKENEEFNFIIFPIILFIFFNWLDLYFKVILFLILGLKLAPEINPFKKLLLIKVSFFITISLVTLYYGFLFVKDTKSYLGNQDYLFSISKEDVLNLEYKNPTFYISGYKYFSKDESRKIFDFLIKNFPDNQAILFHSNKLL